MNNCSIIKEIKRAEESIESCYQKLAQLENILKTKELPIELKRSIKSELQEFRKLLATNEDHLSRLHGENRRSFVVAGALIFVIFLIYGLYVLLAGGEL